MDSIELILSCSDMQYKVSSFHLFPDKPAESFLRHRYHLLYFKSKTCPT